MQKKSIVNSRNVRFLYLLCFVVLSIVLVKVSFSFKKWKGIEEQHILHAIILPHHDILVDKFPLFYSYVKDKEKVKRIVFLSPNHFEPNENTIKTKEQDYIVSQKNKVFIDTEFVEKMKQEKLADIDEHVFVNEHAVNLHLSSISNNFPTVKFVPILLTRNVQTSSLESLIDFLLKNTSAEDTLFIVSTDFSHNLPFEEAQKRDDETLALLYKKDFDGIRTLNDEYTDCPECLYVLFRVLDKKESVKPVMLFHGNSRDFMYIPDSAPTTSYFVISI